MLWEWTTGLHVFWMVLVFLASIDSSLQIHFGTVTFCDMRSIVGWNWRIEWEGVPHALQSVHIILFSGIVSKQFPVFTNLDGISCYTNSVLQAMGMLPRLGRSIERVTPLVPEAWSRLGELLKEFCWHEDRLSHAFRSTIAVRQELSQLTGKHQYAQSVQMDAHEFLDDIIAQLPVQIQVLFQYRIFYHRICPVCKTAKPIGQGQEMSVLQLHPEEEQQFADLLRRKEEETRADVWCETCQRETSHRERPELRIGDSQQYLLVHLSPIGPDGRRIERRQIRSFQANQMHIYGKGFRTVAAIEHDGQTAKSAHYMCWVRSTGGWMKLDDRKIRRQENKRFVANLRNICILFMEAYWLVDIWLFFGYDIIYEHIGTLHYSGS